MATLTSNTQALDPHAAVAYLLRQVEQHLTAPPPTTVAARLACLLDQTDPAAWLAAQTTLPRCFWSDRAGTFTSAGLGRAAEIRQSDRFNSRELISDARRIIQDAPASMRLYGGIRFDDRRPAANHWQPFGACRFLLPRFELCSENGQTTLAVNLLLPDDLPRREQILSDLRRISFTLPKDPSPPPPPLSRTDSPRRNEWLAAVREAVEAIRAGDLEKIVLARESRFALPEPANPLALTRLLQSAAPGCYHFCFQFETDAAFLGATPERLYLRDLRRLESEALAGTRPRGATDDEDTTLGNKLLASAKEAREHAFVADEVERAMHDLCRSVTGAPDRALVRLARVQHMVTRFSGVLRDEPGDADLLDRLHPTPAVGGLPTDSAINRLRTLEPFDRGWYAGPIGWLGRDSAEFAVGIRSALVDNRTLRLFSGAGIVDGSHPEREWDEIENKIASFLKLLGAP